VLKARAAASSEHYTLSDTNYVTARPPLSRPTFSHSCLAATNDGRNSTSLDLTSPRSDSHSHASRTGLNSVHHQLLLFSVVYVSIGVGDGEWVGGGRAPLKFGTKYFSGNYYVKFGHFGENHVKFGKFVDFSENVIKIPGFANFSGKSHVKFGHFVNFSYIFLGENVMPS